MMVLKKKFNLKNVLIIEDCDDDLKLYRRLLKKISPDVNITHSAESQCALSNLQNTSNIYDCIFLDYSLPGENGLTVLEKMDDALQSHHGPVIVLTGQGNEDIAVQCMRLGAADYIEKRRLSVDSLTRSIQNALEKHYAQKIAQEREHELSVFAETLSHDLKAPLGRVQSYLGLLSKKYELHENLYVQNIQDDVAYMDMFLKRLMEYTREGRSNIEMSDVSLDDIIEKSIRNLEVPIQEKKARVEYKHLPHIKGDAIALTQLFQNLISNALRYNNAAPYIEIEYVQKKCSQHIYVHDNGIGIPADKTDEIFLPFNRLSHDGDDHMGLGLALCKKIAKQHHGDVSAQPRDGGGSTFCVSL